MLSARSRHRRWRWEAGNDVGWAPLYPGSPWIFLIEFLILIVLIVGVVVLIIALVRGFGGERRREPDMGGRQGAARQILDE